MSIFTGEYECKLDAKGRLALPSRIKSRLPETSGNQVVLMRGMEPCLVLYSLVEYRKIYSRIAALNEFNEEYRKLQRNFFRRVAEIELDSAGRLLVPKMMMKYASLEKDVIVVGMGNRVEIWNTKVYDEYLLDDNEAFSKLAEKHLNE
ncbi:MAG TPA: division/cell wall cluster transcriptional repressor MraZ [Cytophagales bacterium]|jgi:MraZ protein|nr:division/cell wall cluster transcriptional repressor MraZ [Cytophagales bacterium]